MAAVGRDLQILWQSVLLASVDLGWECQVLRDKLLLSLIESCLCPPRAAVTSMCGALGVVAVAMAPTWAGQPTSGQRCQP